MNSIGDFFARLGFQVDVNQLPQIEADMQRVQNVAMAMSAAMVAAGVAVAGFVAAIADGLDELGDFAEQEQVAVETIQELGYAAQLSGSSLDAVKKSIEGVNKVIGEASLGIGRGAKIFETLGLSAKNSDGSVKNFDQQLSAVADKMKGLSRQEQIAMAEKLGIDRGLIPLLNKGAEGIATLREEAQAFGVASQQDTEIAGAFNDALDQLRFVVLGISRDIAVKLMPIMTKALAGFRDWWKENKEIIKQRVSDALLILTTVLGVVYDWITWIVGATIKVVSWFGKFKVATWLAVAAVTALAAIQVGGTLMGLANILRTVTLRLAAFNLMALVIPVLIGAVAIAIALLVDEFITFSEGGDSYIGDLVEKFPWLVDAFDTVKKAVIDVAKYFMALYEQVKPSLERLGVALIGLGEALWPVLKALGGALVKLLQSPIAAFMLDAAIDAFANFIETIARVVGIAAYLFTKIVDNLTEIVNFITFIFERGGADWLSGFRAVGDAIKSLFSGIATWLAGKFDFMGNILRSARELLGIKTPGAPSVPPALAGPASPSAPSAAVSQAINNRPSSAVVDAVRQAPSMAMASGAATTGMAGADGATGAQGSNGAPTRPMGILGRAASGTSTSSTVTYNTTEVKAPITINNPDPVAAGKEASLAIERQNRQATRNGQSKVDI